ncbi:MAG TPA: MazG family protein, partial [Pseudobdellovibrionaceae bacterium]|nr:MazG family protein [Pseudobdellovibrionaceae bacterium]
MSPSAPLKKPDLEIQKEILELVHAIEKLRGPGGCPWDLEQNHQTLAPYALEEVCELLEALDTQNYKLMQEELGDVLFQVVLHSELAKESGHFTMADVIKGIREKIIRRHPHVFGNTKVNGTAEVLKNWEEIKKQEKALAKTLNQTLDQST